MYQRNILITFIMMSLAQLKDHWLCYYLTVTNEGLSHPNWCNNTLPHLHLGTCISNGRDDTFHCSVKEPCFDLTRCKANNFIQDSRYIEPQNQDNQIIDKSILLPNFLDRPGLKARIVKSCIIPNFYIWLMSIHIA